MVIPVGIPFHAFDHKVMNCRPSTKNFGTNEKGRECDRRRLVS